MRKIKYATIDEYIDTFPNDIKDRLNLIRDLIKQDVPKDTEETISYQIPCFKLNGKFIIYFAGYKNHISTYPIPPGPKSFQEKIAPFVAGRGTIQFKNTQDLPINLIKEIIKYNLEANQKRNNNY